MSTAGSTLRSHPIPAPNYGLGVDSGTPIDLSSSIDGKRGLAPLRTIAPRVLRLAQPETSVLTVGLLALLLAGGINLLFPFLIRQALNGELGFELINHLPQLTGLLIALFLLQAIFFYIRHYCFTLAGYSIVTRLRAALYRSMVLQDIEFYDRARVGDLLSRLTNDTQAVQRAATINISVALRYSLQALGGVVLMAFISIRLTLVILLMLPLLAGIGAYWGKQLRTLSLRLQEQLALATVIAEESIAAIRTVKLFGGEAHETARQQFAVEQALITGKQRTHIAAFFSSLMVFLMHSSLAVVLCYGGMLVTRSELSLGDLTAFLLYGVIVAVSLGFLSSVWDEFMQAVGAAERIFEILDQQPTITSPPNLVAPHSVAPHSAAPSADKIGKLTFTNVHFSYPSRPAVKVLDGLSLEINPGETVAIVGPSGAGKSTLAHLIPRFYDPQQGEIRFADLLLNRYSLTELRQIVSAVPQDPQLFSVSIAENISYGKPTASLGEITTAARIANLHEFIESLPEGYRTLVGERGVQLSGGQRQRVAIARAVLRDPKFLILDEATSSLDSENEQLVQQALQRLMTGRTTLVIAHRLSTVVHADRVIVLRNGRIVQSGTHQELLTAPGLYKTLVEHQLL